MKERYNEILRLKGMLEKAKITFVFSELFGGYHIISPNNHFIVCSVIEHDYSYGREQDLLEIMNRKQNDVLGYLTAENVFQIIEKHWKELKR